MNDHDNERDANEVEARLRLTLSRPRRALAADEIAAIRSRIERQQPILRRLQSVPLANGEEPAPGFDPAPWALPEELP